MRLLVRFEKGAKEQSGTEKEMFYMPPGTHTSELKRRLGDIYVALRDQVEDLSLRVNGQDVTSDKELHDGDEVVVSLKSGSCAKTTDSKRHGAQETHP